MLGEYTAWFAGVLEKEGEDNESRRKKHTFAIYTSIALVVSVIATVRVPVDVARGNPILINDINGGAGALVSAVTLVYISITKSAPDVLIEASMYFWGVLFMSVDITSLATGQGTRGWPLFVVLLDVVILCDIRRRVSKNLILLLSMWLLLSSVESAIRFGLFDLPGLASPEQRREHMNCEYPPCEVPIVPVILAYCTQLGTFILDFKLTQNFATGLKKEHQRMLHSITVTKQIANTLAHFDLKSAEECLADPILPADLAAAFQTILSNLHVYRPFLPHSLQKSGSSTETEAPSFAGSSVRTEHLEYLGTQAQVSTVDSEAPYTNAVPMHIAEKRRASFTVINLHDSHTKVAEDNRGYEHLYGAFVNTVLSNFALHKGVVSLVVGDHVHGTFNVSKKCPSHAVASVRSVTNILRAMDRTCNAGISSGEAFCGPFGCTELMTLVSIGQPVPLASCAESYGRENNMSIVCMHTTYVDVSHLFTMKLVLAPIMYKTNTVPVHLYELLMEHDRSDTEHVPSTAEWMYELHENSWVLFNEAGRRYLLGETQEALRLLNIPTTLGEMTLSLRNMIIEGIKPRPMRVF